MSGALADFVGRDLSSDSQEVVVSSGGDTFVRASSPINVYLYAKGSPLHERLVLAMPQHKRPYGISTVVPGKGVHAVTVASRSACWASAFAQDIANRLSAGEALASALNRAESVQRRLLYNSDSRTTDHRRRRYDPQVGKRKTF